MSQALAHLEGSTPDDLAVVATQIREYLTNEDEQALGAVAQKLNEHPGIIRRFFPSLLEKEEQRLTVERLRSVAEAKAAMFDLFTEVRFEIARREGQALIQSVGMHLQGQLTAFATAEMDGMWITIGRSKARAMEEMIAQAAEIEKYRGNPLFYDDAIESLKKQKDMYFAMVEELFDGFVATLKSRIASPQQ